MEDSFQLDSDGNLRCGLLESFEWLRHGFGTRAGVLPALPMASVKQVHSARIVDAARADGVVEEGDALVTSAVGLAAGIKTADCVPILLVDIEQRVVAAVHAGWRGTVQQIAPLTIQHMKKKYGAAEVNIFAAIGPAIGGCCYEVGEEVASRFAGALNYGKAHLDLKTINREQLRVAGIPAEQIAQCPRCTKCDLANFFSFRGEGEKAGRMTSWIAKKKAGHETRLDPC